MIDRRAGERRDTLGFWVRALRGIDAGREVLAVDNHGSCPLFQISSDLLFLCFMFHGLGLGERYT